MKYRWLTNLFEKRDNKGVRSRLMATQLLLYDLLYNPAEVDSRTIKMVYDLNEQELDENELRDELL